jgi:hypothetical protein
MKKKVKKIRLSRETLRSLSGQSLGAVTGGQETVTLCNRDSYCITCPLGGDTRTCPP